jgi:type IX secretion system PorP/SprF family membrane protein
MKTHIYIILFFLATNAQAQEVLFSQPYSTPSNINPALTGAFNAKNRVTVQTRQGQEAKFDKGSSVAFDRKYILPNDDYIGLGVNVGSKDLYLLSKTFMKSAVAYGKYLGGSANMTSQYLVASGELEYQQNILDLYKAYNLQPSYSNDPLGGYLTNRYMDVSIGAMWYAAWKKGKRAYIGLAWHHLNKPNIGFYEKELLPQRYTVHVGCEIPVAPQLRWVPTAIYIKQGNTSDKRVGLALKITAQDTLSIQFGAAYRSDNTFVLNKSLSEPLKRRSTQFFFRVDYQQSIIHLSYDIYVDGYSTNNVLEMSYTYCWGETQKKSKRVPIW